MFFSQIVMYSIIVTSAAVLHAHGKTNIATASDAAAALGPLAGPFAYVLFAAGIIGAGLLAIPILSGSAAYAVKELFGLKGALAIKPWYRPTFYGIMVAATIVGVVLNMVGRDMVKALFYSAVANGIVAPPLMILIRPARVRSRRHGQRGQRPPEQDGELGRDRSDERGRDRAVLFPGYRKGGGVIAAQVHP